MWVVSAFDESIVRAVSGLLQNKIRITVKKIYTYTRWKTNTHQPAHLSIKMTENRCTNTLYSCTYLNVLIYITYIVYTIHYYISYIYILCVHKSKT